MTTATAEKSIRTGNVILDMELPLLTENELGKMAEYAKFLRWSRDNENSGKKQELRRQSKRP